MSTPRSVQWLWAGLLTLALVFPLLAQGNGTKIKVTVENASIRLKPSLDSEAIEENIPVGFIYTSDKKVGEWYEIKFESKLGVALLGYIHEMYVEVVGEAVPAQPEVTAPEVRQPERRPAPPTPAVSEIGFEKIEIFAGAGMGFGSFLNDSSHYVEDWSSGFVTGHEEGDIQHKMKSPLGAGLFFSYFFSEGLGLRLRVDPGFGQKISDSQSLYTADFSWSGGADSYQTQWDTTGSLSVLPLSFDLVYRFPSGMISPYINAGISYFVASFKADSTVGWANAWYIGPSTMTIDYAPIPISIDEKLDGLGFNVGAGLDFHLGPGLALTLDAAYFMGKSADFNWYVAPGDYYYNYNTTNYSIFDDSYAQIFSESLGKVKVTLSFFKILVGIKLFL
jgi:hypothetical protein